MSKSDHRQREHLSKDEVLEQAIASASGYRYKADWRRENPTLYRRVVKHGLTKATALNKLFITYDDRDRRPGARPDRAAEITERIEGERATGTYLREPRSKEIGPRVESHQNRNFKIIVSDICADVTTFDQFEKAHPQVFAKARDAGLLDDPGLTGHFRANTPGAKRLSLSVSEVISSAESFSSLDDWQTAEPSGFMAAFRQGLLTDVDVVGHMPHLREQAAKFLWPHIENASWHAGSLDQLRRERPEILRMATELGLTTSPRMTSLLSDKERSVALSDLDGGMGEFAVPDDDVTSGILASSVADPDGMWGAFCDVQKYVNQLEELEDALLAGWHEEIEDPFDEEAGLPYNSFA